jgi:hypothetical protein
MKAKSPVAWPVAGRRDARGAPRRLLNGELLPRRPSGVVKSACAWRWERPRRLRLFVTESLG